MHMKFSIGLCNDERQQVEHVRVYEKVQGRTLPIYFLSKKQAQTPLDHSNTVHTRRSNKFIIRVECDYCYICGNIYCANGHKSF
jgi:hypothetical protein